MRKALSLLNIYGKDRTKEIRDKRYTTGTVLSVSGGEAEIDVGATLPDGTPVTYTLPCAEGFNAESGATVVISYMNDSPHSGIVTTYAGAADVTPEDKDGVTNGDNHDHNGGDGAQIDHANLLNKGTNTHAQIDTHIADTSIHPADSNLVHKTGNETIAGVKTFSSFPVGPSSSPTTDYQMANKKYVDDHSDSGDSYSLNQKKLEATLEALLNGTLLTKTTTQKSMTLSFGNAATDNNGTATWSGTWSSSAGYRSTIAPAAYMEIYLRCYHSSGSQSIVLSRGYGSAGGSVTVEVDGATHGTWNQTNASYTISNVANGVHRVKLINAAPAAIYIGSIQYTTTDYQGCGVDGDIVEVMTPVEYVFACTIGMGSTDNGATYFRDVYGESIMHRLPHGGNAANDNAYNRDALTPAGLTASTAVATGMIRGLPFLWYESSKAILKVGDQFELDTNASCVRGLAVTASSGWGAVPPALSASVVHTQFAAFLGKVVTPGAGSNFSANDLCLVIATGTPPGASATTRWILDSKGAFTAVDLFEIP